MKKVLFYLTAAVAALVLLASCGGDEPSPDGPSGDKKIKLTFTTSSSFKKETGASLSMSVSSATSAGVFQKWAVNGEPTGSEDVHFYSEDHFDGGKTLVFESPSDYMSANVHFGVFSIGEPFTITYKLEQGDRVVEENSIEINKDMSPISKNWSLR